MTDDMQPIPWRGYLTTDVLWEKMMETIDEESADDTRSCNRCHGSGLVPNYPNEPLFGGSDDCPDCGGTGTVHD
jgi:DnaJ-class molecular chaperone